MFVEKGKVRWDQNKEAGDMADVEDSDLQYSAA